jgi:hypothetical protein
MNDITLVQVSKTQQQLLDDTTGIGLGVASLLDNTFEQLSTSDPKPDVPNAAM